MAQAIKRGIIQRFSPSTYLASVLILEATSSTIDNVPIANHSDGTSVQVGAYCAVLFFDENNFSDAVILACYPNSTAGGPPTPPGRVSFIAGSQQINGVLINSGVTSQFNVGGATPNGILGIVYKAYFTSPTAGAYIHLAPHGGAIGNYATIGNLAVASGFVNGSGILQVDSGGNIDIQANGGNCTVTLFVHGYII